MGMHTDVGGYSKQNELWGTKWDIEATPEILDNWDNIKHMHKYLLTKDMLIAGTYLGEYPNMVKGAVGNYMRENNL